MSNTMIALLAVLDDIAASLRTIAASAPQTTPDYQRRLEEFAGFDWQAIGATVLDTDNDGPAAVEWRGRRYTRRAPQNKFDAAIWFSRASGRDEDGTVHYERLITFKVQAEPEPLPAKAKQALAAVAPAAQNGNGHSQKAAVLATPAPAVATAAQPTPVAPATAQPAPAAASAHACPNCGHDWRFYVSDCRKHAPPRDQLMPVIVRDRHPLDPAGLRLWLRQEAYKLGGRACSNRQRHDISGAWKSLVEDDDLRRAAKKALSGYESAGEMPDALVLAMHGWLRPAGTNGSITFTDSMAGEEVALVLDLLRSPAHV